ncbi:MAG: DcaP family trimeric outer membrane transporter [Bacteroidota bacterium]
MKKHKGYKYGLLGSVGIPSVWAAGGLSRTLHFLLLSLLLSIIIPGVQAQTDDPEYSDSTRAPRQPLGRFPDDAIVTRGSFERSISIKGAPGAFRVGGNVIVNATFDFDNLGFQQISTQPTIPLNGTSEDGENQFAIHARSSRVNFDYRSPTEIGELRVFVELGLFGIGGGELINEYTAHVRHAVAELGKFKFGQFWSGFMDVFSQPETADPGGPLALPSKRNPAIYYVSGEQTSTSFGVGIENPTADMSGRTDLQRSESLPSLVGFVKLERNWGYVRLAGMTIQQRSTSEDLLTGGVHLSGRLNMPFTGERDNFAFGAQAGEGFVHYYSSFIADLDGIIRDDGSIEATRVLGAFGAYQHWWSDRLRSNVNASFFDFDLPSEMNPFAYAGGYRFGGNLVWTPIIDATFGIELNYDALETFNGSEGDGLRLEFVSRFDF